MKNEELSKMIFAAISGAVGGAIIGLLFAPKKGSTTRKDITKRSNEYLKKANGELKRLNKEVSKQAKTAKDGLHDLGENAKDKGMKMVKNTKKLTSYDEWTKDELYDYAKEKDVENYSTMNKAELIEALSNR